MGIPSRYSSVWLDTETTELTVKALLSHLINGEFNSPANSLRAGWGAGARARVAERGGGRGLWVIPGGDSVPPQLQGGGGAERGQLRHLRLREQRRRQDHARHGAGEQVLPYTYQPPPDPKNL
eukprot:227833-Prorocentrum_minimum.AAC.1